MIFAHPLIPPVLALGSTDPGARLTAAQHLARLLATPGYFETLRQHRLTPLIYQTLTSFPRRSVGEVPFLKELRQDYSRVLKYYTVQEKETRRLVEVLARAGVEVILLKGADIRHRLYDDPVTRPMGDVDVLISPADLEKAWTALGKQGYSLHVWDLDPQPGFNARFDYDISFEPPSGAIHCLDIHWEIREVGALFRLPYAPLRARATVRDLGGVSALVLAPEHLLMHLCLHTFEELEAAGLLKMVDLDRALRRLPLDWDLFLADAARFGIQGPVYWLFRQLERLRPGALPGAVLERLDAYRPGCPERLILKRGRVGLLVASLLALWRHLPLKAWPPYLKGKLWPTAAYLRANAEEYGNRAGYLRHLLKRARASA